MNLVDCTAGGAHLQRFLEVGRITKFLVDRWVHQNESENFLCCPTASGQSPERSEGGAELQQYSILPGMLLISAELLLAYYAI